MSEILTKKAGNIPTDERNTKDQRSTLIDPQKNMIASCFCCWVVRVVFVVCSLSSLIVELVRLHKYLHHPSSNLGETMTEGCFNFRFASLPLSSLDIS